MTIGQPSSFTTLSFNKAPMRMMAIDILRSFPGSGVRLETLPRGMMTISQRCSLPCWSSQCIAIANDDNRFVAIVLCCRITNPTRGMMTINKLPSLRSFCYQPVPVIRMMAIDLLRSFSRRGAGFETPSMGMMTISQRSSFMPSPFQRSSPIERS